MSAAAAAGGGFAQSACRTVRRYVRHRHRHRRSDGDARDGGTRGAASNKVETATTIATPRRCLSTAAREPASDRSHHHLLNHHVSFSPPAPTDEDGSLLSPEILALVTDYARQPPTSASLQMLMKAGQGNGDSSGDFWGRTYHSASSKRGIQWGAVGRRLAAERVRLQMAEYLRRELPVRLAHRIVDLHRVPLLRHMDAVRHVKGLYVSSFLALVRPGPAPIATLADEQAFAEVLTALYQNHAGVLVQMARGAYQLREEMRTIQKAHRRDSFRRTATPSSSSSSKKNPWRDARPDDDDDGIGMDSRPVFASPDDDVCFERMEECHKFLDRFYMSRIGIRFLAGQYLSLRNNSSGSANGAASASSASPPVPSPHYVGMICLKTSPAECVRLAAYDASLMCRRAYGRCPRIEVTTGRRSLTDDPTTAHFPYIPTYLHYILLELLKNALRATMEAHRHSAVLPPVEVIIADGAGNEDVVIKIADEGGGISRSRVDQIWSYLYTTADPHVQKRFVGAGAADHGPESPLAGLGYGLPIARGYCRYFGGDLDLISLEGYGTDAFVHLKRLGNAEEPVPV